MGRGSISKIRDKRDRQRKKKARLKRQRTPTAAPKRPAARRR